MSKFIAFDWCGWNDKYGRYTLIDPNNCDTLLQRGHYDQQQWDRVQLDWLRKYPLELVVYNCPNAYVADHNQKIGTVAEIIERLERRLATKH